jgi:hypothetical protein
LRRHVTLTAVGRGNARRLLAAVALLVGAAGCDLVGPTRFDAYELMSVGGQALPYTIAPLMHPEGKPYDLRISSGSLAVFQSGRAALVLVEHRYLDGVPEPGGREVSIRHVFTVRPGQEDPGGWRTRLSANRDTAYVSTYFAFDYPTYLFVRR